MEAPPLTRYLAAAGALPFIACALAAYFGVDSVPLLGAVGTIAAAYGLTIASFLAGVHWGTAVNVADGLPVNLYVASNVVAVIAWLVFLLGPVALTLAVLALLFLYLLYVDFRLYRAERIGAGYWQTRLWVSAVVVACLLLLALRLV